MAAEDALRWSGGKVPGEISSVVWVGARFAQRATDTRQWASAPDMSLGMFKYQEKLAARGWSSGVESEGAGPTANV